jgi:hypothetical protein
MADELIEILRGIKEPRFTEHVRVLTKAVASMDAKIGDPTRSIPSHELLDIYRGRRDGAQSRGRPTEGLDALVELFGANQGETWRIFTVSGAGADGGVFLSDSGRAGCFARPAEDS